jgi:hypothetical protein
MMMMMMMIVMMMMVMMVMMIVMMMMVMMVMMIVMMMMVMMVMMIVMMMMAMMVMMIVMMMMVMMFLMIIMMIMIITQSKTTWLSDLDGWSLYLLEVMRQVEDHDAHLRSAALLIQPLVLYQHVIELSIQHELSHTGSLELENHDATKQRVQRDDFDGVHRHWSYDGSAEDIGGSTEEQID